jgi:hypothetical protein
MTSLQEFLKHAIKSALRIRDILVRIQIRIRGSVPLTNGSLSVSGRPKNIRDPTDLGLGPGPDPQHCIK